MRKVGVFLGVVLSFNAVTAMAGPECGVFQRVTQSGETVGQVMAGSELPLLQHADGSLYQLQRKEWIYTTEQGAERPFFYVVTGFQRRSNGCHRVMTASGFTDDQSTWLNTFSDWCEDGHLIIYPPALKGLFVRCWF